LYCAVVVALLFYHRIVVDYFVLCPPVLWYSGMGDWEDGAGADKAYDFFGLGCFPEKFVGATLGTGISEWFAEGVKVQGVRRGAGGLV
jgi:hypothetical protein